MAARDPLGRALAAYRVIEPRRRQSPFDDPRLVAIARERAARAALPAYHRFLRFHPGPAFVASGLALLLLVAPATLPATTPLERSNGAAVSTDAATPGVAASPRLEPVAIAAPSTTHVELFPLLLTVTALVGGFEGVRRLRAGRG